MNLDDEQPTTPDEEVGFEDEALETDVDEEVEDSEETDEDEEVLEAEPSFEEVEYEGKTYSVPPEIKKGLMINADYTRKTQTLADERRDFEAKVQQAVVMQNAANAAQEARFNLAKLEAMAQQYENVDWARFQEANPGAAAQAQVEYQKLRDEMGRASQAVQQAQNEFILQHQSQTQERQNKARAALERDIEGWSEAESKVSAHAERYDLMPQEVQAAMSDPRFGKILHRLWEADMAKEKAAKATRKVVKVKPTQKVKGKARGGKDPTKMTTDEWMAWRNKQVANQ